ncbi:organic cation transporter protein-like isoform X1 [Asterias amurensis]|uniref:organic cation transporter protein-like isoform X1 n=1 Tax=Asterias amurensis TaxID=7602 RepID=UPI003AB35593
MAFARLDDALYSIGKYGRYQLTTSVIITALGTLFPAWQMMGIIFSADRPKSFHCTTTNGLTLLGEGTAGPNASVDGRTNSSFEDAGSQDACQAVSFVNGSESVSPCTEWTYERIYNESTIVTDLNLVCDLGLLAETAQSIFLFGMLIGAVVFGYLSDVFGRKVVLLGACVMNGVLGVAVAFVWNYVGIAVLWFLTGMFAQGYNMVQFVMIMEMFPSECRTLAGSLNNLIWGVAMVLLAPIGYTFTNWRHMQLVISIPCFIALPLWFLLDDSVRWLLAVGRKDKARVILEKMARWNRRTPPPGGFLEIIEDLPPLLIARDDGDIINKLPVTTESSPEKNKCRFIDIFKSRRVLLNVIIVYFLWFVALLAYLGATLNAANLAGNKYINVLLLGVVELPGYLIIHFTMTWWGRRPSLSLFFLVAGLASITTALLPQKTANGTDLTVAILISAMLIKLCIICSYSINTICCTEILPTPIRNLGFGVGAVCGNIGTVVAPFVLYLDEVAPYLPLTIIGALCVLSSILVPILPETKDKPLPETIEDSENIGKRLPVTENEKGTVHVTSVRVDAATGDTTV